MYNGYNMCMGLTKYKIWVDKQKVSWVLTQSRKTGCTYITITTNSNTRYPGNWGDHNATNTIIPAMARAHSLLNKNGIMVLYCVSWYARLPVLYACMHTDTCLYELVCAHGPALPLCICS